MGELEHQTEDFGPPSWIVLNCKVSLRSCQGNWTLWRSVGCQARSKRMFEFILGSQVGRFRVDACSTSQAACIWQIDLIGEEASRMCMFVLKR